MNDETSPDSYPPEIFGDAEISPDPDDDDLQLDWVASPEITLGNGRQKRRRSRLPESFLISLVVHAACLLCILSFSYAALRVRHGDKAGASGGLLTSGTSAISTLKANDIVFGSVTPTQISKPVSMTVPEDVATQDDPFLNTGVNVKSAKEAFSQTDTIAAPTFSLGTASLVLPRIPATTQPEYVQASLAKPSTGGFGQPGDPSGTDADGTPIPDYPADAQARGEQGTVILDLDIKPDGSIASIEVVRDCGSTTLVSSAIEAAKRAKVIPATLFGTPIGSTVRLTFNFVLHSRSAMPWMGLSGG